MALDAGEMLFARGDPGNEIYLVVEGRIRISVLSSDGRELSFAHAVPGDVFGEIAALDGSPRSADATAITSVRLKTLVAIGSPASAVDQHRRRRLPSSSCCAAGSGT